MCLMIAPHEALSHPHEGATIRYYIESAGALSRLADCGARHF